MNGGSDQLVTQLIVIGVVDHAMRMDVLPCQETGAAGGAQWCGREVVEELRALAPNAIDIWRLDEWVARNAERVPAQVIHQNKNNIRPLRGGGRRHKRSRGTSEKTESCKHRSNFPG